MPTVDQNALTILRVMLDLGATIGGEKAASQILPMTQLDDAAFDQADTFLLNAKYVDGTMGSDGDRWLTPRGLEYLQRTMDARIPLSLDAERVLRYMVNSATHRGMFVARSDIMEAVKLGSQEYETACQQLEDFGLIRYGASTGQLFGLITPTQEGRQAVHRNFRSLEAPSTQIQAGAIFHAPVTGGNIQAIASAFKSQIEQAVSHSDPAALRQEITQLLDELVSNAIAALTIEQKAAYLNLAAQFKQEITKPQPDPSTLHKLLTMLGFAGDLDGTLELGQKALELGMKVGPYLLAVTKVALQLINSV